MCISAHRTVSSPCWLFNSSLLFLLAPWFHAPQNRAQMANPMTSLSGSIQKSANYQGFSVVLPTLQHSCGWYQSLACLQASFRRTIISADDFRTVTHDNVTFMIGSVWCHPLKTVSIITSARFRIEDNHVLLPSHYERSCSPTGGRWCHGAGTDCGCLWIDFHCPQRECCHCGTWCCCHWRECHRHRMNGCCSWTDCCSQTDCRGHWTDCCIDWTDCWGHCPDCCNPKTDCSQPWMDCYCLCKDSCQGWTHYRQTWTDCHQVWSDHSHA